MRPTYFIKCIGNLNPHPIFDIGGWTGGAHAESWSHFSMFQLYLVSTLHGQHVTGIIIAEEEH